MIIREFWALLLLIAVISLSGCQATPTLEISGCVTFSFDPAVQAAACP